MTGRSILDGLNAASKAGVKATPSARFRTKEIDIDNIYRNELNQYSLEGVDDLARSILVAGRLFHNLVVVYDPNREGGEEYRLVSGERRLLALHKLVDCGHTEYKLVTCQVIPKGSQAEERLAVILANTQRDKTAADRVQEYEGIKKSLEEMREAGVDFYGRNLKEGKLRDHMAAIMQEADGTLAAMEKISRSLTPELRELMEEGKLNFTTATAAASLTQEEQHSLAEMKEESEGEGDRITKKDVQAVRESGAREKLREEYAARPCEKKEGSTCSNADNLITFYRDGATSGCAGCCAWCTERKNCEKCCAEVKNGLQEAAEAQDRQEQETTGAEEKNAAQGRAEADQGFLDDAHPEHAGTLCYSCLHWSECSEKSDRVTACDKYKNPAAERQPIEQAAEVQTRQATEEEAMRTDEQLVTLLHDAVDNLLEDGMVNQQEANRIKSLLAAMHRRWINTGCWKPYGAAEEEDEREKRRSQDANARKDERGESGNVNS